MNIPAEIFLYCPYCSRRTKHTLVQVRGKHIAIYRCCVCEKFRRLEYGFNIYVETRTLDDFLGDG